MEKDIILLPRGYEVDNVEAGREVVRTCVCTRGMTRRKESVDVEGESKDGR